MSYRTKLSGYFGSRDRGWILSLLAAVCLLYLPFLGSPFFFDDLSFFFGGAAEKYAHSPFQFDLRWLPYASLGWTEMMFSNVVTHFFHLGNMLLHAANVIVLFYLLRLVAGAVAPENGDSAAIVRGAWFGALIFALHPVAVYAAGYGVWIAAIERLPTAGSTSAVHRASNCAPSTTTRSTSTLPRSALRSTLPARIASRRGATIRIKSGASH